MTWRRILVALGVLSLSAPADAQYFGQNKIQYDRFDFAILQTPHFDVYYYNSERDAAKIAARLAERWYARFSVELDHAFLRRQPIILYASHGQFAQTSIIQQSISEGIGGFTDQFAGRVVLPFAAGLRETDHVLGHEIVHAFQRDILRQHGGSLAMLPLWFAEGMAEYLSLRELDVNTKMWLRDSAEHGKLPTIAQLDDPKYFPYRYGQALWAFLAHDYGQVTIRKALTSRAKGGALGRLREATGKDAATLSTEWHAYIKAVSGAADPPAQVVLPKRVIGFDQNGGRLNVAPAISPDGRRIVFLSERDGFSVDVFVADAATGIVQRKLLSSAADPHFDSLQFVDSAGAWDSTGRWFVLATLRDGHPALTIFDMLDGTVHQEVPVPSVDQIFSPTWSPDGRRIAFSALRGGLTDLFVAEIATGDVQPLTNDPYSDLQPSWSPDGQRIVFATDRFTSSVESLTFGDYQLATVEVKDRAVRWLGGLPGVKNIDPHWSADGSSVFFVSDADGASNVHCLDVLSGQIVRVTLVPTGVTGITALSPAISVSATAATIAMSLYADGMYEIRTVALDTSGALLAGPFEPTATSPDEMEAGSKTPEEAATGPKGSSFLTKPYVPRLSLAQIGTPYLSAGGGPFGSFVRGGASVAFGDMLGQQELDTAIQVGKDTTDNAVMATYMNRWSRLNWGFSGGRIPALVGASDQLTQTTDPLGRNVFVHETTALEQIHWEGAGLVAYPLNRAERIEASLGVDRITFNDQTTTTTYSAVSGATLSNTTLNAAGARPATILQAGAAFVHDTALFGAASPVLGGRYRFAFVPSFGDVRLLTTVADVRHYVMPVRPFTIALRAEGVARTGAGATDSRLLPLIWNMRDFVRGFDTDNDTIRTTRFTVANIELRAPVAGLLHRNSLNYGKLPIEAVAFGDYGRFWYPDIEGSALSGRTLCSAGAGARLNAAGFIFEFDAVRPFGMYGNGWGISFNFQPGF